MGGDGALAPKEATLLNLDKGGRLWVTHSGQQGPGSKQFFIEPSGSRLLLASGELGLERKFLRIRAQHPARRGDRLSLPPIGSDDQLGSAKVHALEVG